MNHNFRYLFFARKSSKMRPGSAYRGGTASRLPTGNVGAPPPTAIGRIGTANFGNVNIFRISKHIIVFIKTMI